MWGIHFYQRTVASAPAEGIHQQSFVFAPITEPCNSMIGDIQSPLALDFQEIVLSSGSAYSVILGKSFLFVIYELIKVRLCITYNFWWTRTAN